MTKRFYGWPEDAQFLVPDGVYDRFRNGIGRRGGAVRDDWVKTFAAYKKEYPQAAREIELMLAGELPADWDAGCRSSRPTKKASRRGRRREKSSIRSRKTFPG